MAGCFGNHPYDRYLERQLDEWLDSQEEGFCPNCEADLTELEEDDIYCPECGKKLRELPKDYFEY